MTTTVIARLTDGAVTSTLMKVGAGLYRLVATEQANPDFVNEDFAGDLLTALKRLVKFWEDEHEGQPELRERLVSLPV